MSRGDTQFRPTVLTLSTPLPDWGPSRLLWLVVGLVLASGAVVAGTLWVLHLQAVGAGERLTRALAHAIAEQTARSLQAVDQRLQIAALELRSTDPDLRLDAQGRNAVLQEQIQALPLVRAMWVLDAQGRIAVHPDPVNIGRSMADRDYFQRYLRAPDTGFAVGQLVRSRFNGRWLMTASRPLHDRQGGFRGVIVAAIEPPTVEAHWRELDMGDGGSIALYHRDGQLLMRTPAVEDMLGRNFSQAMRLFTDYLASSREGHFRATSNIDGVERIFAYRVLPAFPQMVVTVGSSLREVMGPWRQFAWLTGTIWLVAVTGSLLLALQLYRQGLRRRHMEQRFRELAQAMPQIVFVTSNTGVLEFLNERWSEATGRPTELALGSRWDQLAHPEDAAIARESIAASLAAGAPIQIELRLRHRDGHDRWQLVRAVPNRDGDGQVVSWFGTSTDVHALKHAHDRLRRQSQEIRELNATLEARIAQRTRELANQEALFRTLAEQAPLPIWTVDPLGRCTFFSRAWYELVGGEPPQWQGDDWLALVHPDDVEDMRANWKRVRREGHVYQGTRRLRAQGGRWHTTTYRATPVRAEDGQIGFWVGVDADVTDLTTNQEALRLANEQLRAFSYTVSHDLQSPLQRIGSFAQLLQREPALQQAGDKSAHYLQRIMANADEMVQMVQGLLALSRVTQADMVRSPVQLSEQATQVLEQLHASDPARQVHWKVQPGLAVLGDPGLMHSVLENLLGNAWKFTGGRDVAVIAMGRKADGDGAFFVRDNGAGFDMQHAGKLFGTFERLHRQDEFPGTGIGLATVQRAIQRQGGQVWAESRPGEGATFFFTMPVPVDDAPPEDGAGS